MFFIHRNSLIARFVLILVLLGGMFGAVPSGPVQAATLTVTNTNDNGAGSLRQAILDAVPGDTINFDPSLAGQTIALTSQINLDKDLVIDGSGLDPAVEISGGPSARIFYISSNSTITLSLLSLKNGRNSDSGGGAIFNEGNLTVAGSTFINNTTTGNGGAIYSRSTLHISNSVFISNRASSGGAVFLEGGIFLNPTSRRTIVNSTFVSNQANPASGMGGAIFIMGVEVIFSVKMYLL